MGVATGLMLGGMIGSKLIGAKMQSSAAKKAAQAQQDATRQASQYTQQGIGQLAQLYSPYVNAGASAMNTLGRLTTPGPGARYASTGIPNAMPTPTFGPPMGGGYGGGGAGGYGGYGGPPQGPYAMAEGGDIAVQQPTLFLAGEAGPERATFQPMGPPGGGGDIYGGGGGFGPIGQMAPLGGPPPGPPPPGAMGMRYGGPPPGGPPMRFGGPPAPRFGGGPGGPPPGAMGGRYGGPPPPGFRPQPMGPRGEMGPPPGGYGGPPPPPPPQVMGTPMGQMMPPQMMDPRMGMGGGGNLY